MINKAFIHPLFLLSITDQVYRKNELNEQNGDPVQGLILGANSDKDNENGDVNEDADEDANRNEYQNENRDEDGNNKRNENRNTTQYQSVSLLISFELPYKSTPEQVDTKIELLKIIYGNLKVIGFYQISANGENAPHKLADLIHSWDLGNAYSSTDLVIVQVNPDIGSTKSLESNIRIMRLKDFAEIEDKEVRTISSESLSLQSYNKAVASIENFANFQTFDGNNNDEDLQLQDTKEQEEIAEGLIDLHYKLCELVDFCDKVISGNVDVYGEVHVYESIKVVVKLVDTMKRVRSIATVRTNHGNNSGIDYKNNHNNRNMIDKLSALAICSLSFNEENVLAKSTQLRSNE